MSIFTASRLSVADLIQVAIKNGFGGSEIVLETAVAVALAESDGDPTAHRVTAREDSRGLWQVNVRAHPQYASQDMYEPNTNARAAFAISRGGTDWHAWTTYTSG